MELSFSEQLRIILKRENISISDLATRAGVTRQNINQRLNRGTLSEKDMKEYAHLIGYNLKIELVKDRGEN